MATTLDVDFVESFAGERPVRGPIVVATDGTHDADGAVLVGTQLARRDHMGATMLSVVEPSTFDDPADLAAETERFGQLAIEQRIGELGAQRNRTRPEGAWAQDVRVGHRVDEVVRFAGDRHAPLIVLGLGSHGVLARLFHRETALRVIRAASTPVLAVPALARGLPRTAVVGVDFSPASQRAARHAADLIGTGGTVYLAHVMHRHVAPSPAPIDAMSATDMAVRHCLDHVRRQLADRPDIRVELVILHGDPAQELIAFADHRGVDAIAVGSSGAGTDGDPIVGSVATKIIRSAHAWVLVTPQC